MDYGCDDSKLRIIDFYNTTGQATCLPERSLFCDEQRLDYLGPCCDGLSCVVKDMIHMTKSCQNNGSGKTHYKLLFFYKDVKFLVIFPTDIIKIPYLSLSLGQNNLLAMENWKPSCRIWCQNSFGRSYCCSWLNHNDAFIQFVTFINWFSKNH